MQKPREPGSLVGGLRPAATSLSRISEGPMALFPPRTHKFLRYHENVTLSSTSGALSTYVFRANDLYDPNYTGTGHSAMGSDQMLIFYNHFCVDTCKVTVNCANTAAGSFHVGIRQDATFTALTDPNQMIEFGGITYDVLEAKNTYGSSKTMSMVFDIARIQGVDRRAIMNDSQLRGDATNFPLEITYIQLVAWDPNGLSGSINFDVVLEFGAWFLEPRDAVVSVPLASTLAGPKRKPRVGATMIGAASELKSPVRWF